MKIKSIFFLFWFWPFEINSDLSYLDKPYENDCPRSSNIYFDNLNFELPEIGIFRHSRKCKFLFDLFTDFSNIHPTQTLFRSSWLANSDHLFIFLCASSEESAVSFLIVWNKKCETFRKLSANRSNLPPSVEKWKSVFPRAEIFPRKEWRNAGGEKGGRKSTPYVLGVALIEVCLPSENQDRPDAFVSAGPLFHYARRVSTVE